MGAAHGQIYTLCERSRASDAQARGQKPFLSPENGCGQSPAARGLPAQRVVAAVLVPGPRAPAAGEHDLINGPQSKSAASPAGRSLQAGGWLRRWAHSLLCGNVVRNALRTVKAHGRFAQRCCLVAPNLSETGSKPRFAATRSTTGPLARIARVHNGPLDQGVIPGHSGLVQLNMPFQLPSRLMIRPWNTRITGPLCVEATSELIYCASHMVLRLER